MDRDITIEIVEKAGVTQPYHFRVVADNGKILCSSENYVDIKKCQYAATLVTGYEDYRLIKEELDAT